MKTEVSIRITMCAHLRKCPIVPFCVLQAINVMLFNSDKKKNLNVIF